VCEWVEVGECVCVCVCVLGGGVLSILCVLNIPCVSIELLHCRRLLRECVWYPWNVSEDDTDDDTALC
jgi:hypothetical protein